MNDKDPHFGKLLDYIFQKLNLNCRQYNESYIKRRINSRLLSYELGPSDYADYMHILEKKSDESRKLFDALTVNVTNFFRDKLLWDFLKNDVFPAIIQEKKDKNSDTIRIWSCGCSSGEEPYSASILLNELLPKDKSIKTHILATDIDKPSLTKAKFGMYNLQNLEGMPPQYIAKYFHKSDDGIYKIDESIKNTVTFIEHNFFNDLPPSKNIDLIFCRNVVIYFTLESKGRLMNIFHKSLAEHGWLALGESEILFVDHMKYKYYLYNEKKRIYRKERRTEQKDFSVERRKKWWYGYKPVQ